MEHYSFILIIKTKICHNNLSLRHLYVNSWSWICVYQFIEVRSSAFAS